MLKSGVLTGASLKAAISLKRVDEDSDSSDDQSDSDEEANNKRSKTPGNPEDI